MAKKKQLKQEIKALRAKCQRLQLAYRDARIRLEGLSDQNEELLEELNAERGNTQFQERVTNALEEIAAQGRPRVILSVKPKGLPQDASDTPPEPEELPATSPDDSSDLII